MTPERRITASHPDYKELNGKIDLLGIAINPQCKHWSGLDDVYGRVTDMDEPERQAVIEKLKDSIGKDLEGGRFADFIGSNPKLQEKLDELTGKK